MQLTLLLDLQAGETKKTVDFANSDYYFETPADLLTIGSLAE